MKKLLLLLLLPASALACEYDFDCAVGAKCLKQIGADYGVCKGGMAPGNRNDQVPVFNRYDRKDPVGSTCNFDADCGMGQKCLKSKYAIDGVCR